jgi:hypothetical protein
MLEYTKSLLQKVSFDKKLFLKELGKSLGWLSKEERQVLQSWILSRFNSNFRKEISLLFDTVA